MRWVQKLFIAHDMLEEKKLSRMVSSSKVLILSINLPPYKIGIGIPFDIQQKVPSRVEKSGY